MKKKGPLEQKSFSFAVGVVHLYKKLLADEKEFILSKQLVRSGTSIGAMTREAAHAESKADFIHKLAIAQKEANETSYWLDLLHETDYIDKETYLEKNTAVSEIQKILSSSILTTKERYLSKK